MITLVNIGVGRSNAKTAADHITVLRPHAWLMVGHCAGLRSSQNLGNYGWPIRMYVKKRFLMVTF